MPFCMYIFLISAARYISHFLITVLCVKLDKKIKIAGIAVLVVIIFVVIYLYYPLFSKLVHPNIKSNVLSFNSSTLSFNFNANFSLENNDNILSSKIYSTYARLLHKENSSVIISIAQNSTNFTYSYFFDTLKNLSESSNVSLINTSILGYPSVITSINKSSNYYELIFIYGPKNYYTFLQVNSYKKFFNVTNSEVSFILKSIRL